MSEMSLRLQIQQIEEMKQYIDLCQTEMRVMNDQVASIMNYLRKEGLPKEIADKFEGELYMGKVNYDLEKLTWRLRDRDYRYLENVQQKLQNAINQ